jgi:hypothetical protein
MKLTLSQFERAGIATVFLRPQSRGGSPDALLIQDDLHTLLGIDEFEVPVVEVAKLDQKQHEIEIPDSHVEVLRQMLGWPGQDPKGSRIVARVLRKLQLAPAPATPEPAGDHE